MLSSVQLATSVDDAWSEWFRRFIKAIDNTVPKYFGLMQSPNWVGSHCPQKCFTMVQNLAVWMIKRAALSSHVCSLTRILYVTYNGCLCEKMITTGTFNSKTILHIIVNTIISNIRLFKIPVYSLCTIDRRLIALYCIGNLGSVIYHLVIGLSITYFQVDGTVE